jgi:exosortase
VRLSSGEPRPQHTRPHLELQRDLALPYGWVFGLIVLFALAASAFSYRTLAPLAEGESPQAVLLLVPLAALVVLAFQLAPVSRHGDETAANVGFALPLVLIYLALVLILPAKLSYFYWLYRFDLLTLPVIVAVAVILFFGLPALWSSRSGFLLLLFSWPPLLDWVVQRLDRPLTVLVSRLAEPLVALGGVHVERRDELFTVGTGAKTVTLTVASACSGMVSVFAFLLVGGALVLILRGSREAKAAWLGLGIALVLAANVVRVALVLSVAGRSGIDRAFDVVHTFSGAVLFLSIFFAMLLLLSRFGLTLALPRRDTVEPLHLTRGGVLFRLALLTLMAAGLALMVGGSGFRQPGLYFGAPKVTTERPIRLPPQYHQRSSRTLPSVAGLFGDGAKARTVVFTSPDERIYAAQVVLTESYESAQRYGVLDCFVVHDVRVYSARRVALPGGGTALLAALSFNKNETASISWIQPVLLGGERFWRRVILYGTSAIQSKEPAKKHSFFGSLSVWLLNKLSPYGYPRSPERFRSAEENLTQLAGALTKAG